MYHAGCLGTAVPQVSLCAQVYLLINYPLCSLPSSRVAGPRETLAFPSQVFMLGLITGGGGGPAAFLPWSWPVLGMACTTSDLTETGVWFVPRILGQFPCQAPVPSPSCLVTFRSMVLER